MKNIIFLALVVFSSTVFSEEFAFRPVGNFTYTKEIHITKKRTAETVDHSSTVGAARIKDLKKIGFTCFRKNQTSSICQKIETDLETPAFIQKAVDDYLEKAKFNFAGTGEPVVIHDGASTEWAIYETVMLGAKKIDVYKIVKANNGLWYLSFPISEDQGIATMELRSDTDLGFPLTLQVKENVQTVAYFITANFIKE